MKLLFWLISLGCFYENVIASYAAGGHEWLFYYYAYKLDYLVNDGDKNFMEISQGHSSSLDTFNEFVKYNSIDSNKKQFKPVAGGNTFDPDIMSLGPKFMVDSNVGQYNIKNLLFSYKDIEDSDKPNHSTVWDHLADVIQDRREYNAGLTKPKDISSIMNSLKLTAHLVYQNRRGDNSAGILSTLRTRFPAEAGWKFIETPKTADDGRAFQEIDLRASRVETFKRGLRWPEVLAYYADLLVNDKTYKRHNAISNTVKKALTQLEASSADC